MIVEDVVTRGCWCALWYSLQLIVHLSTRFCFVDEVSVLFDNFVALTGACDNHLVVLHVARTPTVTGAVVGCGLRLVVFFNDLAKLQAVISWRHIVLLQLYCFVDNHDFLVFYVKRIWNLYALLFNSDCFSEITLTVRLRCAWISLARCQTGWLLFAGAFSCSHFAIWLSHIVLGQFKSTRSKWVYHWGS